MGQDSVRRHEAVMRNERAEVGGTNPFGQWVRAIDGPVPVPDTAFAGAQPTTPSGAPLMRH